MKINRIAFIATFCILVSTRMLQADVAVQGDGLTLHLDDKTGNYSIHREKPAQDWSGSLGCALKDVTSGNGQDDVGAFSWAKFSAEGAAPIDGQVKMYLGRSVVEFEYSFKSDQPKPSVSFPKFTSVPAGQHLLCFQNKVFAPPTFEPVQGSMPWVMFDDDNNTTIISPAANFMTAGVFGDGKSTVESGFVPELSNLPKVYTHRTLIAFGKGQSATFDLWGKSLLQTIGAKRPTNDADIGLKYLGYWTDNGAVYYYHYDADKGYAGTVKAVADELKKLGITIGYMQLDSWWYQKTSTGPDGHEGAAKKNKDLPEGSWNKYGGLWEYTAHPDLFPNGLLAFNKELGLPFITHSRWIDVKSPYREKYKISGVGAIDPKWWDDIAQYLKDNGVMTYEQDWLDRIYDYSPEFRSTPGVAEAFTDNMARATKERGLTMQYCMELPRYYLQGAKYENLTSVRVSDDHFGRGRWKSSLYVQQLASALGEWPWVDVFMSRETPNLILATMSAGMVGVGDEIGKFNVENLKMAARTDGVLVKPDLPMRPIDSIYLADATKKSTPMIARTSSTHGNYSTYYVFAYPRAADQTDVTFSAADIGFEGEAYIYDMTSKSGKKLATGASFTDHFSAAASTKQEDQPWKFYIVAPVSPSGIALIGDTGKFATMGRQRIDDIQQTNGSMTLSIVFAEGEKEVTLIGYVPGGARTTSSDAGPVKLSFDGKTNLFSLTVARGKLDHVHIDIVPGS